MAEKNPHQGPSTSHESQISVFKSLLALHILDFDVLGKQSVEELAETLVNLSVSFKVNEKRFLGIIRQIFIENKADPDVQKRLKVELEIACKDLHKSTEGTSLGSAVFHEENSRKYHRDTSTIDQQNTILQTIAVADTARKKLLGRKCEETVEDIYCDMSEGLKECLRKNLGDDWFKPTESFLFSYKPPPMVKQSFEETVAIYIKLINSNQTERKHVKIVLKTKDSGYEKATTSVGDKDYDPTASGFGKLKRVKIGAIIQLINLLMGVHIQNTELIEIEEENVTDCPGYDFAKDEYNFFLYAVVMVLLCCNHGYAKYQDRKDSEGCGIGFSSEIHQFVRRLVTMKRLAAETTFVPMKSWTETEVHEAFQFCRFEVECFISQRDLRLAAIIPFNDKTGYGDILKSQCKLLLEGQELRKQLLMYEIASNGFPIILLKALGEEADRFKESFEKVKKSLGKLFMFSRASMKSWYKEIDLYGFEFLESAANALEQYEWERTPTCKRQERKHTRKHDSCWLRQNCLEMLRRYGTNASSSTIHEMYAKKYSSSIPDLVATSKIFYDELKEIRERKEPSQKSKSNNEAN